MRRLTSERVEEIRRVFKKTRNYSETARRMGLMIQTVIKYVGKGKSPYHKGLATDEKIWRAALQGGGNLSKVARGLGYADGGGGNVAMRMKRMGQWREFRRRFPMARRIGRKAGINFERDILSRMRKTRGNTSWIAEELGIHQSVVVDWIKRRYPRGSVPEERYRAFREDYPWSPGIRRKVSLRFSRACRVLKSAGFTSLSLEKIQEIRRVFRQTRHYGETSRRVGVNRLTVMRYVGKGKGGSRFRKNKATDEEIWEAAIRVKGRLMKAAKELGYETQSALASRIHKMGRWEEYRKMFPVFVSPRSPLYKSLSFERDILPRLQETHGNTLWVADLIGVPVSGIFRWIERDYPKGGSRSERYRAFRKDFPVHEILRRSGGFEPEESSLKRRAHEISWNEKGSRRDRLRYA